MWINNVYVEIHTTEITSFYVGVMSDLLNLFHPNSHRKVELNLQRPVRLKTGCGLNPKITLTTWAATYNVTFPPSFLIRNFFFNLEKNQGCKILIKFNFAGFRRCIMQ